jgi:hypothetical protein
VLFDEIYFNDIQVLNRIKNSIDNTTNTIIIATGDSEQVKPVNEHTNQAIYYGTSMDSVMSQ